MEGSSSDSRAEVGLLGLAVLAFGGLSLWLGQDLNFDLLAYHFYTGYAFVHGRLDQDVAPVGWHTYINPLPDAFHYLGMVRLPPRVFGFALGMLHGLNLVLLYLIARSVLAPEGPRRARLWALLSAGVGSVGPNAISLLGTTMGQNLVSLPALLAVLVVVRPAPDGGSPLEAPLLPSSRLFWAGVLSGVATGLRLTMLGCHLSLFLALLVLAGGERSLTNRLLVTARFGLGSLLGFMAASGYWSWLLLERFGNPIFPFANQIFHSPFYKPEFFRDRRFMALTLGDWLRPPLDIALGQMGRLQEINAHDGRFLLLFVALFVSVAVALSRRRRTEGIARMTRLEWFLVVYWLIGYGVWVVAFYYYRYLTPLELLAPLVLFALLRSFLPRQLLPGLLLVVSVGLAAYSRTDTWGRGDWRANWLGLTLPSFALQPKAMVLLLGGPISFAIPSFLADARFIHLTNMHDEGGTPRFDELIARTVAGHRGPVFVLSTFRADAGAQDPRRRRPRWVYDPAEDAGRFVAPLGLALTDHCAEVPTRRMHLYLCELARTSSSK